MPKKRTQLDPLRPLPAGLYRHRAQYRARDALGRWHYFRGSYREVCDAFAAWKEQGPPEYAGSIAWLMDKFTGEICPQRARAQRLSPRTARDYAYDAKALKAGLGKIPLVALRAGHVATYRDARAETNPAHIRHELACLSSALQWAVEAGHAATNVAKQVRRPSRKKRQRLITDAEYMTVHARAEPSVQLAMLLAVRTLALPSDLLRMGAANVARAGDRRILRYRRGKTGALVEMELVGELAEAIDRALEDPHVRFQRAPFVHTRPRPGPDGKLVVTPYTIDGIGAMFRRYCVRTKDRPADPVVTDFGLRDLRAKGATEMYRAGVDIRQIQQLLGHGSETTTRIYLKGYITEIVRPNMVPIIGAVK